MNEDILKSIWQELGGDSVGSFSDFTSAMEDDNVRRNIWKELGGDSVGSYDDFLQAIGTQTVQTGDDEENRRQLRQQAIESGEINIPTLGAQPQQTQQQATDGLIEATPSGVTGFQTTDGSSSRVNVKKLRGKEFNNKFLTLEDSPTTLSDDGINSEAIINLYKNAEPNASEEDINNAVEQSKSNPEVVAEIARQYAQRVVNENWDAKNENLTADELISGYVGRVLNNVYNTFEYGEYISPTKTAAFIDKHNLKSDVKTLSSILAEPVSRRLFYEENKDFLSEEGYDSYSSFEEQFKQGQKTGAWTAFIDELKQLESWLPPPTPVGRFGGAKESETKALRMKELTSKRRANMENWWGATSLAAAGFTSGMGALAGGAVTLGKTLVDEIANEPVPKLATTLIGGLTGVPAPLIRELYGGGETWEKRKEAVRVGHGVDEGIWNFFMDGVVTKDDYHQAVAKFDAIDNNFFTGDNIKAMIGMLGRLSFDIPASIPTRSLSFFVQGTYEGLEEIVPILEESNLSDKEKAVAADSFASIFGLTYGLYNKIGIDYMLSNRTQKMLATATAGRIAKQLKDKGIKATPTEFVHIVDRELKSLSTKLLTIAGGGFQGFIAEALANPAEEITRDLLRYGVSEYADEPLFGENFFYTPDLLRKYFNIGVMAGPAGAIPGSMGAIGKPPSIVDTRFGHLASTIKTSEDFASVREEIAEALEDGILTEEEAYNMENIVRMGYKMNQGYSFEETNAYFISRIKGERAKEGLEEVNKKISELDDQSNTNPDFSLLEAQKTQLEIQLEIANDGIREILERGTYEYIERDGKYYKRFSGETSEEIEISEHYYAIKKNAAELNDITFEAWSKRQDAKAAEEEVTEETPPVVDVTEQAQTVATKMRNNEALSPDEEAFVMDNSVEVTRAFWRGGETEQTYAASEVETAEVGSRIETPVKDMEGKPVVVENHKGDKNGIVTFEDGMYFINMPDGTSYELGTKAGVENTPLSDATQTLTLREETPIQANEDGTYTIRDKQYVNNNEQPTQAINRDEQGNIVSVTLDTPDGQKRTFRGQLGEDIAYAITIKEITKDNETRQRVEEFVASERESGVVPEPFNRPTEPIVEQVSATEQSATRATEPTRRAESVAPQRKAPVRTTTNDGQTVSTPAGEFTVGQTYERTLSSGRKARYTLNDVVSDGEGTYLMFMRDNGVMPTQIASTDVEFLSTFDGATEGVSAITEAPPTTPTPPVVESETPPTENQTTTTLPGAKESRTFQKGEDGQWYTISPKTGRLSTRPITKPEFVEHLNNISDSKINKIKEDATEVIKDRQEILRLSKEEEQGRKRGDRGNVEATLILTRGGKRNGKIEGREAQQQAIEEYAKDENIWYDNIPDNPNVGDVQEGLGVFVDSGVENLVYVPEDNPNVVRKAMRTTDPFNKNNPNEVLYHLDTRISAHNAGIGATVPYTVIGFGRLANGDFVVITEQPRVKKSRLATREEIEAEMRKMGYESQGEDTFANENYFIADVNPKNVLVDDSGNLHFIDSIYDILYEPNEGTATEEVPPVKETPKKEEPPKKETKKAEATETKKDAVQKRKDEAKAKLKDAFNKLIDDERKTSLAATPEQQAENFLNTIKNSAEVMKALLEYISAELNISGDFGHAQWRRFLKDEGIELNDKDARSLYNHARSQLNPDWDVPTFENTPKERVEASKEKRKNLPETAPLTKLLDKYSKESPQEMGVEARQAVRNIAAIKPDVTLQEFKTLYPQIASAFTDTQLQAILDADNTLPPIPDGTIFNFRGNDYTYSDGKWDGRKNQAIDNAFHLQSLSNTGKVLGDARNIISFMKGYSLEDILTLAPNLRNVLTDTQIKEEFNRLNGFSIKALSSIITNVVPNEGETFRDREDGNVQYTYRKGKWTAEDTKKQMALPDIPQTFIASEYKKNALYDQHESNIAQILTEYVTKFPEATPQEIAALTDFDSLPDSTPAQRELKDAVKRTDRTLNTLRVPHKIFNHTADSFGKFAQKVGVDPNSKGFVTFVRGGTMEIHLSPKADVTTAYHETVHGVLYSVFRQFSNDPALFQEMAESLKNRVSSKQSGQVKQLFDFIDQYPTNKQAIEFITELTAQVANGKIKLSNSIRGSIVQAIIDFLNKIAPMRALLNKVGVNGKYKLDSPRNVVRLLNTIAQAVKDGSRVEELSKLSFVPKGRTGFIQIGKDAASTKTIDIDGTLEQKGDNIPNVDYSDQFNKASKALTEIISKFGSDITHQTMIDIVQRKLGGNIDVSLLRNAYQKAKFLSADMVSGQIKNEVVFDWVNEVPATVVRKSREATIAQAYDMGLRGYDGVQDIIMRSLNSENYQVSDVEQAGLVIAMAEVEAKIDNLRDAYDMARAQGEPSFIVDQLQDQITQYETKLYNLSDAFKRTGTVAARILSFRSSMMTKNMTNPVIIADELSKYRESKGLSGRIDPSTKAAITRRADKLQALSRKLRLAEKRNQELIDKALEEYAQDGINFLFEQPLNTFERKTAANRTTISEYNSLLFNLAHEAVKKLSKDASPQDIANEVSRQYGAPIQAAEVLKILGKASVGVTQRVKDRINLDVSNLREISKIFEKANKAFEKAVDELGGINATTTKEILNAEASISNVLTDLIQRLQGVAIPKYTVDGVATAATEISTILIEAGDKGALSVTDGRAISERFEKLKLLIQEARISQQVNEKLESVSKLQKNDLTEISKIDFSLDNRSIDPAISRARADMRIASNKQSAEISRIKKEYDLEGLTWKEKFSHRTWGWLGARYEDIRTTRFTADASAVGVQGAQSFLRGIASLPELVGEGFLGGKGKEYFFDPIPQTSVFNLIPMILDPMRLGWKGFLHNNYDAADYYFQDLIDSPMFHESAVSGLIMKRPGDLNASEEYYRAEGIHKIPFFNRIVKASEIHMTMFLNLASLQAFYTFKNANPNATAAELRRWAAIINEVNGRKEIPDSWRGAMNVGAYALAAPRLYVSRYAQPITLANSFNPLSSMTPAVRMGLWEHYAQVGVGYMMLGAIMRTFFGMFEDEPVEVGADPYDSTFLKYKIGKNRSIDLTGGFGGTIRFYTTLFETITGMIPEPESPTSQKAKDYAWSESSPAKLLLRELQYRTHPAVGVTWQAATGKNIFGVPVHEDIWKARALAGLETLPISVYELAVADMIQNKFKEKKPIWEAGIYAAVTGMGANIQDFEYNPLLKPHVRRILDNSGVAAGDIKISTSRKPKFIRDIDDKYQSAFWEEVYRKRARQYMAEKLLELPSTTKLSKNIRDRHWNNAQRQAAMDVIELHNERMPKYK